MKKIVKNYGYVNDRNNNRRYYITKGQWISGYTVGILVQDVHYPLLPGNVVNAYTYDFPVRHLTVEGANQARMHTGDPTLVPDLIKTAKQLEIDGCRVICGSCGYFGHFQKAVADAIDSPVYLSSIVQIPWIRPALKTGQKIGILCADGDNLTPSLFAACGITDLSDLVIESAGHLPEFSALLERRGHFDNGIIEDELISLANKIKDEHPNLGAILLECSDMPPYAAAIQRELQMPVYDFITMIKFAHSVVAQKTYEGFI